MRALLVAMLVLGAGCKSAKKDEGGGGGGTSKVEQLTPAERKRGEDACTTYVRELCACAARRPDDANLAEQCEKKKAKPEALGLLLALDDDASASDDSRARAQIEARKLIAKCVMEHASLPSLGCR